MADVPSKLSAAFVIGILALSTAGCADFDSLTSWNPFSNDPKDMLPGVTPPAERIAKLRVLGKTASERSPEGQQQTVAELAEVIRVEEDPMIRAEIVHALAEYQCEMATRILQAALEDDDPDVRVAACKAWGKRTGTEAIEPLGGVLESDTDVDVRLAAAEALGSFKEPSAATALEPALNDKDPALQYRAVLSLREITGKDLGKNVARWQQYVRAQTPQPANPISVAERAPGRF